MKLGELLLVRSQLQKDLGELQTTFSENAQREEGEDSTLAEEALRGYLTVADKVERVQVLIQRTNAEQRFDGRRTMMEVLLEREMVRKQVPALTAMLRSASSKTFGAHYGRSDTVKYVPAVSVGELRKRLSDVKGRAQTLDTKIQARNWEIEVEDPFKDR